MAEARELTACRECGAPEVYEDGLCEDCFGEIPLTCDECGKELRGGFRCPCTPFDDFELTGLPE